MSEDIGRIAARCGFRMVESSEVTEIDGSAHRMVHEASGAKLLFLRNDDDNKAFAITFKTPPQDDTGVFHILEHSVLCGSDKFPVKEPFVDLLKGSMQTFLNAMTFPDKTMYPVATTNDQDLMNLMDVYLDAVFHPLIYRKPTIFQQEGWHYELQVSEGKPELVYNGVVFNEMKGALADPDSVLYDSLSAALFPDTPYRYESGGVPSSIVDLTYEGFLDAHRAHYRADNSYIVLYGAVDIERVLGFLDREYLTPLAISAQPGPQIEIGAQAPLVRTGIRTTMCTAPENACAAYGFVAGEAADRERLIAADLLMDALFGSNEAPLKRAVLDAQIGDDCVAYLEDSVAQPFAVVEVKGLKPGGADELGRVLERACRELCETGIGTALLEASLSHAEFIMREHDMGYADGVVYAMAVMSGWLYGDDLALARIRYEEAFADLRSKLGTGYFERLLRELFLENDHYAQVELVPVEGDAEAALAGELARTQASMDEADLDAIRRDEGALRDAQQMPDAPEALMALPRLTVEQIGDAPAEEPPVLEEVAGIPVLRHRIASHGIAYAYRYFDLDVLSFDELPYASVLAMLLGKLGTAKRSAAEVDLAVQARLGALSFFTEAHERMGSRESSAKLVASASALSANAADAAALADEVLTQSDLGDHQRIYDILLQRRVAMEQAFASAGHSTAIRRAASYHLPAGVVREQLGGVGFYLFLKELIDGFDERKDALTAKLRDICQRIVGAAERTLSFTGDDDALARFMQASDLLEAHESGERLLTVPEPVDRHEGLIVPTDVSFTALASSLSAASRPYAGVWPLLSRALTYGYLWQEVRVLGGAYGTGFNVSVTGPTSFYSYRDPHLDETLMRFRGAPAWLAGFDPEPEEFAGYVVSSVASMDAPVKPRELARRQDGMWFAGYTPEMRAQVRREMLDATVEEVRAAAGAVEAMCARSCACSVGSRQILESSDAGLTLIDLVG